MTFSVLFVCTGNICRSPMGERLFAVRAEGYRGAEIQASSAGTNGLNGYPMDLPSAGVLRELGGDPGGHSARRVTAVHLDAADLVLTATREQRAALLTIVPTAFRRTFTMREFGRLGARLSTASGLLDDGGLRARVREVAARRGVVPAPERESADDIGDPFGASMGVVRRLGDEVSSAVDAAIAVLGVSARR